LKIHEGHDKDVRNLYWIHEGILVHTLEDVSTVFVDPDNCELSPNPSMETLIFTSLFPKFTIGKGFKLAALTKKKG
jgi:hypothetical protein